MIKQVVAVMETLEKRAEVIGISLENMRECLENVNLQLNLIDL